MVKQLSQLGSTKILWARSIILDFACSFNRHVNFQCWGLNDAFYSACTTTNWTNSVILEKIVYCKSRNVIDMQYSMCQVVINFSRGDYVFPHFKFVSCEKVFNCSLNINNSLNYCLKKTGFFYVDELLLSYCNLYCFSPFSWIYQTVCVNGQNVGKLSGFHWFIVSIICLIRVFLLIWDLEICRVQCKLFHVIKTYNVV